MMVIVVTMVAILLPAMLTSFHDRVVFLPFSFRSKLRSMATDEFGAMRAVHASSRGVDPFQHWDPYSWPASESIGWVGLSAIMNQNARL